MRLIDILGMWFSLTEHAMHIGTPPLLAGKISRDIKLDLDRSSGDKFRKSLVLFSKFFGVSCLLRKLFVLRVDHNVFSR